MDAYACDELPQNDFFFVVKAFSVLAFSCSSYLLTVILLLPGVVLSRKLRLAAGLDGRNRPAPACCETSAVRDGYTAL